MNALHDSQPDSWTALREQIERNIQQDLAAVRDMRLYTGSHPSFQEWLKDRFPEFADKGAQS